MSAQLLTDRETKFVDAIVRGLPACESYIVAGYSKRSAGTNGPRSLRKEHIAAEIQRRRAPIVKKTDELQTRVLNELEAMAFGSVEHFTRREGDELITDFTNATPEQLRAISRIKNKTRTIYNQRGDVVATERDHDFTLADKYRGLELLGRHLGMF